MVKMKTKETVLVIALAAWAVQHKYWSYFMPAAQGSKASTAIIAHDSLLTNSFPCALAIRSMEK